MFAMISPLAPTIFRTSRLAPKLARGHLRLVLVQPIHAKATPQAAVAPRETKLDEDKAGLKPKASTVDEILSENKASKTNLLDELFSVIPSKSWREDRQPLKENAPSNKDPNFKSRTMEDSWLDIRLNFKDEPDMVRRYEDSCGEIQVGKIMEDLDKLAAGVAYKYCDEVVASSCLTIVTASVDRLELRGKIYADENYRLGGYVTHVGYSSLEVFIQMDKVASDGSVATPPITFSTPQPTQITREPILVAKFTMVARNKFTGKTSQVNSLRVQSPKEKALFDAGLASKVRKIASAQRSLDKVPPTAEERLIIHDMYLESLKYLKGQTPLPANSRWMDSTQLQSVLICQPQDRNVHKFIFGGFLMRLAYNLSYATAYTFLDAAPEFVASDEIQFRKSVPVGSILTLTSKVCYAPGSHELTSAIPEADGDPTTFQVAVQAHIKVPGLNEQGLTNTFRFTFRTPDPQIKPVPHILARSYAEFIEYLEARRRVAEQSV